MKKARLWIAVIPFSILAFACNSNNSQSGSNQDTTLGGKVAEAATDVKNAADTAVKDVKDMMTSNPDSDFVVKAITNNKNEIILLKAGMKDGYSHALREDAKKMLTDHNMLEKKLEAYSIAKNYPVNANDEADKTLADMSGKTGNDWDKAWADKLVAGHKDNINAFEKARNDVKDDELKKLIDNALPTFQSHLEMVSRLRDNLK